VVVGARCLGIQQARLSRSRYPRLGVGAPPQASIFTGAARPSRAHEGRRFLPTLPGWLRHPHLNRYRESSCPRVVAPPRNRLNRGIENASIPRFSRVLRFRGMQRELRVRWRPDEGS